MATIEGNEIALRNVAADLIPPARNGQAASVSQDDVGPPFLTRTVSLLSTYQPQVANAGAPAWVYGLCVDSVSVEGASVLVSWGSAGSSNETIALPGQVILIPRGARRVFLRGSVDLVATVTWFTDRYADKRYSPKPPTTPVTGNVTVVNTLANPVPVNVATSTALDVVVLNNLASPVPVQLQGTSNVAVTNTPTIAAVTAPEPAPVSGQVQSASGSTGNAALDTGTINTAGRKYWGFAVINGGDATATWTLYIDGAEVPLDTGTVPAGDYRIMFYGPGVAGPFPANTSGHSLIMPGAVHLVKAAAGDPTGNKSQIIWWGRY